MGIMADAPTVALMLQDLLSPSRLLSTPPKASSNIPRLAREMERDLLASRELAWRLMVRDISAQYRQSFLGIFWAFFGRLCRPF